MEEKATSITNIIDLPRELIIDIMLRLDTQTRWELSNTCTYFNEIYQEFTTMYPFIDMDNDIFDDYFYHRQIFPLSYDYGDLNERFGRLYYDDLSDNDYDYYKQNDFGYDDYDSDYHYSDEKGGSPPSRK